MEDTYTALQTDMDRDAYTPKRKHRRTATPALADSYGATQLLPAESLVANGDLLEAIGEDEEEPGVNGQQATFAPQQAWHEKAAALHTAKETGQVSLIASSWSPGVPATLAEQDTGTAAATDITSTTGSDSLVATTLPPGSPAAALLHSPTETSPPSQPPVTATALPAGQHSSYPGPVAPAVGKPAWPRKHKRTPTPALEAMAAPALLLPAESFVANGQAMEAIDEAAEELSSSALAAESSGNASSVASCSGIALTETGTPADAGDAGSLAGPLPTPADQQLARNKSVAAAAAWATDALGAAAEQSASSSDSFELELGPARRSPARSGPPKPSSENGQPHDQRKPMEQPPVLHSDATPLPAAATEATSQELHQAPPVVLVQGEGLQHASAGAQLADDDDEFDYSSPGSKRAVPFTVPIFEAAPAPAHLITHISNAPLESFAEEDEECASEHATCSSLESHSSRAQQDTHDLDTDSGSEACSALKATERASSLSDMRAAAASHVHGPASTPSDSPSTVLEALSPDDADKTPAEQAGSHAATVSPAHGSSAADDCPAVTNAANGSAARPETADAREQASTDAGSAPAPGAGAAAPPQPHLQPAHLSTAITIGPCEAGFELEIGDDMLVPDAPVAATSTPESAVQAAARPSAPVQAQPASKRRGTGGQDEWEAVNQRVRKQVAAPLALISAPLLTYNQAMAYFLGHRTPDTSSQPPGAAPPDVQPAWLRRLFGACFGDPQLKQRCEEERARLVMTARTGFDDADAAHLGLLHAVFCAFTGETGPPARYGEQWEQVGFQGRDPATDLRSCGLLALLHLALLAHHDMPAAQAIYRLSHEPLHEFPLAVVSINVTKWVLQLLRGGRLARLASKDQSLLSITEKLYVGTMYYLAGLWRVRKCTMAQSSFLLKDVERRAKANPTSMFKAADPAALLKSLNA